MSDKRSAFTGYQVFIIAVIAFIQFTVVLDFMVLSPLGAILLPELAITTKQFGIVVSAYAFSAGASGLIAAGFADKFDRKKLLLFFYTGFVGGTLMCAIAPNYHFLLIARTVTGLFGGVISSITYAIITDLFAMEVRGRVMGFVQMAFAASQVLGIPVGLLLANSMGWHAPFWIITVLSSIAGFIIMIYMKPVSAHIKEGGINPISHFTSIIFRRPYVMAFVATTVLATGGFMLMPFSSAFAINNIGLTMNELPLLYGVTGVFSIFLGPLAGKLADLFGKYKTFFIGSVITIIMVGIYTHLQHTSIWMVIFVNVIMFAGILSRAVSSSALNTAVPDPRDRGAFMSINSAIQQISGGIASFIAGLIVFQTPDGLLKHFDTLGFVVMGSVVASTTLMYFVNRYVHRHHFDGIAVSA